MIDKIHRFQGHGSLRYVYQKGSTVRGPLCSLKYALNRRRSVFRVAVVVSRKVHKSAVVRNRIRRRIYETIRAEADTIKAAYDMVFIVYSDQLATLPAAQLQTVIHEKLEKAHVLGVEAAPKQSTHAIVNVKEN